MTEVESQVPTAKNQAFYTMFYTWNSTD